MRHNSLTRTEASTDALVEELMRKTKFTEMVLKTIAPYPHIDPEMAAEQAFWGAVEGLKRKGEDRPEDLDPDGIE